MRARVLIAVCVLIGGLGLARADEPPVKKPAEKPSSQPLERWELDKRAARSAYDSASAILLADRTSPPTLLLHGRRDPYVWYLQSQRLAARLTALGVPHFFLDLPWATHGFDFNPRGPGGQLSAYAVERFLAAVMR